VSLLGLSYPMSNSKTRREIFLDIIRKIRAGKFRSSEIDPDKLYLMQTSVRHEYQAPRDVSGYNWGHMTSGDNGAGNEEAW
jgi:hypothetical protein